MKTKILIAGLAIALIAVVVGGYNARSPQSWHTAAVVLPPGQVQSYRVKTVFPAHATSPIVTITHSTSGDQLRVGYTVRDIDSNGVVDIKDCGTFALYINGVAQTVAVSTASTAAQALQITYDGTGCTNKTAYTLYANGAPLSLALAERGINVNSTLGTPGVIVYGKTTDPRTEWNITGTEAELELVSTYGICAQDLVWDNASKTCKFGTTTTTTTTPPPSVTPQSSTDQGSDVLNQYFSCYYRILDGNYANSSVKCGNNGCVWPNNTYCQEDSGNCYNTDGTLDNNVDSLHGTASVEWNVCRDESGNPDVDYGEDEEDAPGEPYCDREERGYEQCDVCYDEYGDSISESCWPTDSNDNIADKRDAERQKKDMNKSIANVKKDTGKEYPRLEKEIKKIKEKQVGEFIEKYKKLLGRAGSSPKASKILQDAIAWQEDRKTKLTTLEADVQNLIKTCSEGLEKAQAAVNAIVPGQSSGNELNQGWTTMRRFTESCWPYRNAIDWPVRVIQDESEYADMLYEVAKALTEIEGYQSAIPSFVDDFLSKINELKQWLDTAIAEKNKLIAAVQAFRASTNDEDIDYEQEDLRDAEEDFNWSRDDYYDTREDWHQDDPWKITEKIWQLGDDQRYIEEDKGRLQDIKFALDALADLPSQVPTDDQFVLENLANIEKLRLQALPILAEQLKAAESGQYIQWELLDELEGVFRQSAEVIAEYCDRSGECSLSPETENIIYQNYYGDEDYPPSPEDYYEDVQKYFDEEDLINRIIENIMGRVELAIADRIPEILDRVFSETFADKIATHMKDDNVAKIFTNLLNNAESLGDERLKEVAENSTELYDVLAEFDSLKEEGVLASEVANTVNAWQGTVCASSLKDEVIRQFSELLELVRDGKNTSKLVATLQAKLSENERALVGDKVQWTDNRLADNAWHLRYFLASSFEGDPVGTVRPADKINICEALKIVTEATGTEKAAGDGWWCRTYINTAIENGWSIASGAGGKGFGERNPTRRDIATLLTEAGNLELTSYNNEYPDVTHFDEGAEAIATVKKHRIMTGQGDGRFDPNGFTNRAEVAAMEVRLQEAMQTQRLFEVIK